MQIRSLQMKRALSSVLLILLLSAIGMTKGYAYDFSAVCETGQTLYYNIIDAENHYVALTCPGTFGPSGWSGYTKPIGDIILPESVQYDGTTYSVTSVGNYAFRNCSGLMGSLTIPNSVTSIGRDAFNGCSGFTGSLTLPNSLTTIGSYAFQQCGFTGSLTLPNSLTTIGDTAFAYSGFTGSLTIPNSVTFIGVNPFGGCSGLEQIVVESGNTVYDSRNGCNAIIETNTNKLISGCKSTIIPNSVTSIGNHAFSYCSGFTGSLTIPNSVTTIGNFAFYGCSGFTGSLAIPNSVTTIGNFAFYGCSGFTGSLAIPNSVTSIGNSAFSNCSGFSGSLTLGNSMTTIGDQAFYGCSGSLSITSLAETPPTLSDNTFKNWSSSTSVYVPCGFEEVYTSVSWGGFSNFYEMCGGTVTVDANPEEGGVVMGGGSFGAGQTCTVTATANEGYAFAKWTQNGIIVSMDSEYTFYVTGDMTLVAHFASNANIDFADANVKAICVSHWDTNGDEELSYAEAAAVSNLGQVFRENTQITSFEELQYFIGLSSIGYSAFYNCSGLTSIEIPNSVTTIGNDAFYDCSGLTGSLTIPNTVTAIGQCAFRGCSGFTGSLTIPNSVIEIGLSAFYGCSGFTGSLTIPNSVTTIDNYVFYGCSGFNGSLTIPNSVTSIGYSAFYGCSGFTEVHYNATNCANVNSSYRPFSGCGGSLIIGNDVERIPACMFYNCGSLTNLTIGSSVTTIGGSAFYGCSGFTGSLTIPNSVTTIGENAFYGCSGFTGSLTIGNSVTTIGNYAFSNFGNLSSIIVYAETPPALGNNVFYYVPKTIPMYVPCASLSDYQNAVDWSEFTNYQPATTCASGEITVTANPIDGGTVTGAGYYEGGVTCTLTAISNEGFSFLYWTENDVIVSYDAVYSFIVSGDRSLVANFVDGDLCTITFDLYDSYGDGYTGNYLVVTDENGISQQLTVASGSSAVYTIPFLTGSHITLTWIFGSYPEDCSFTVSYSNGNVICHGENLNSSFSYGFNVDCNSIVFADANVKAICVANWDIDGDGELSYAEAAAVTNLGQVFSGNTEITSFEELQYFTGLTSIDYLSFSECTGLTSIAIPNSVTSIGVIAFYNCSNLTSIDIPNSVISIGESAFGNCTSLTAVTIPNSVTSIEFDAFWRCTSLTTVTIPQSVTSMGENPFAGCSGLEQIIVDSGNTAFDSRENCNAIIETNTHELVTGCKNTTIPNSVTSIGFAAFSGCSGLTSINIPNSVISIGNFAFVNCSGLTSITMSNSLTSIGHYAFWYCSGLTLIDIPNSVTFISDGAFESCSGLTTVTIPSSVTFIESNPFGDCDGLEQIVVDSGNTVYDSRENCNAIIETNTNTLISGCKNTVIPNSVTSIGFSAFYGCSGLVSINIPNSVIYIDYEAFNYCDDLTTLTIPNSLTSIGYWAFHGCSGLTSITVLADDPPVLDDDVFCDVSIEIPVYVPYNTISAYQTASHWSEFINYQEICYTTIPGYSEGEGNYRFIASPLVENTDPTTVDNMITETAYDLYRFDQAEEAEWQNYKAQTDSFVLENGQGYLYANSEEVNVIFKGEFNEDVSKETGLAYDANAEFSGWNLVGNPFPVSAYANRSYYTMNEDGTAVEPNAVSSATPIPACTGIMVMAEAEGETVVFNTEAPEAAPDKGCLQIALSQVVEPVKSKVVELVETPVYHGDGPSTGSGTFAIDKAIVSFNANDKLEKFVFNKDNARISIPQGGKELAIACTDKQSEVPLNFKAAKNGQYTINVNPEAVELDYLHLIDNLTGADVDLLDAGPSTGSGAGYTFTAKTMDYASRFRLVFSANDTDGPSTGSGTFAFVNNGNIIINGEGVLQIVDVMGRIIVSEDVSGNISTANMIPGVYVLRLINGNDVKTQKIVIE